MSGISVRSCAHLQRCGRTRQVLGGWLGLALLWAAAGGLARAEESSAPLAQAAFRADQRLSLTDLERVVRAGSPEVIAARRELAVAQADARQTRLLPNPSFDAAWSTIPVGPLNPRDLDRPLANVPNYAAGLGYTFPLKKRTPRKQRADALVAAARAALDFGVRDQALALADLLGVMATATLRREGIAELVAEGHRAAELAEARLRAQFGTPLDVDQLRIEVERTQQLLAGVDIELRGALASCTSYVGVRCEGFRDASDARAYLNRWLRSRQLSADLSQRPDLRVLGAQTEAARADVQLADAERIPDPTLHLGYLHDRFIVSGNQRNSLNVGVSMPLPVFDHGQAHRLAAAAVRDRLREEQARRIALAHVRIPALEERLTLSRERCGQLTREVIPHARAVLDDLERAVENRLLPLTQVIQARRVVGELFIEEAETCGDAYAAVLELVRETSSEGAVP